MFFGLSTMSFGVAVMLLLSLELDHPGLVQQERGAAAVGGVVGNHHGSAGRQFVELLVLARVGASGSMCTPVTATRSVPLALLNSSRYGWCWKKLASRRFSETCTFGCT